MPAGHRPQPTLRCGPAAASKWKVFGPSASYSEGDAEYFRLTNKLADQYEWFAPRPDEAAEEAVEQEDKPMFGLTPQQIAALGLSGGGVQTPDPVGTLYAS